MDSRNKVSSRKKAFREAVLTAQAKQIQKHGRDSWIKRVNILNVGVDSVAIEELLKQLKTGVVFTPNVDHLMNLQKDPEFVEAYHKADFRLCDSQILMYAAKFLGTPIETKISGSDLFPLFCKHHQNNENIKIFLLGGANGVPERAQKNINTRIGREMIVAVHSPSFGFEKDEAECQRILDMIRCSSANVLMVGVGSPKQEKWIAKYCTQLPSIDIFMAIGAAIDFEAGHKSRAPMMMRHLGFEWLYRLVSEPRRLWRRYLLQDMPFLWLLLRQKLIPKDD